MRLALVHYRDFGTPSFIVGQVVAQTPKTIVVAWEWNKTGEQSTRTIHMTDVIRIDTLGKVAPSREFENGNERKA